MPWKNAKKKGKSNGVCRKKSDDSGKNSSGRRRKSAAVGPLPFRQRAPLLNPNASQSFVKLSKIHVMAAPDLGAGTMALIDHLGSEVPGPVSPPATIRQINRTHL